MTFLIKVVLPEPRNPESTITLSLPIAERKNNKINYNEWI
jgi:hypothetical protein